MSETESAVPVIPAAANIAAPMVSSCSVSVADAEPPTAVPNSLRDDARMQIQTACVDLICEFESMLTRSEKEHSDGYTGEIVPIVNKSLQTALDFGEAHLCGKPLEVLNRRVVEARECSKSLKKAVSSLEWETVCRMIGRQSASELDVLRIHGELGTAIAMVLVSGLGPAIELLGAESESGAEILKIVRVFIAELKERW